MIAKAITANSDSGAIMIPPSFSITQAWFNSSIIHSSLKIFNCFERSNTHYVKK